MQYNKKNLSRLRLLSSAIFLCAVLCSTSSYGVDNNLKKVRFHLYEEGIKPLKVRIALDFQVSAEKMILRRPERQHPEIPEGFIEDFVLLTENSGSAHLIAPVEIAYKNAADIMRVVIADHVIHVAVESIYELKQSHFNYVPQNKVSYIDLEIVERTTKPSVKKQPETPPKKPSIPVDVQTRMPPDSSTGEKQPRGLTVEQKPVEVVKHDTVYAKTHDTLYIEKMVHDTFILEKVVYVDRGLNVNRLNVVNCEHYVHWWNDPHFKIDFQFSMNTVRLAIKESNDKLLDIPADYKVQYVIYPENDSLTLFHRDVYVNYVRCNGQIMLKQQENKCYLLAKQGYYLKPHEFVYDEVAHVVYIRVRY